MSAESKIEWTDATWSPIVGCTRVSEGCRHCYSERFMARFSGIKGHKFEGVSKFTLEGPRWTGAVRLSEKDLDQPLRWKKRKRIFVNSISDTFHEKVPDEWIDRIFAVMALAPQHQFQILTKRPGRMLTYFQGKPYERILAASNEFDGKRDRPTREHGISDLTRLPWRWVWLGVSVEDQASADARIPLLLETPAAVRWVSLEPLLESVDLRPYLCPPCARCDGSMSVLVDGGGAPCPKCFGNKNGQGRADGIDWVVVGGESGSGARPFEIDWARNIIEQCRAVEVPVFYKQGGKSNACVHDSKGGHFDCFPDDLKIREFPNGA